MSKLKYKEPLINCLRRRIAALGGAHKLDCLIDMSRFLRSVRLALHPARTINQMFDNFLPFSYLVDANELMSL